jgi:hypothetical protein
MKITLEITVIMMMMMIIIIIIIIIIPSSNTKVDLKGIGLKSMERIHMAQDRDRP